MIRDGWWQTRWFAVAALLLTAVPLLIPPIPPLLDLPGHMGRYQVMLGADPGLARWYGFHWRPVGYLGVDLLVAALAPAIGLVFAVKLIVIGIPVLGAAGILWLSREAHGRVQPMALLALPWMYHAGFLAGFLNFTLAMALALNALALWLHLGRRGWATRRSAMFVAVGWVVWTAHLFGWLALGVLVFGAECGRRRGRGQAWAGALVKAALACWPLAFPALMFLVWRPSDGNATSDYLLGLPLKPGWLASALRDRWAALDIGSVVLVTALIYRAWRAPDRRVAPPLAGAAMALLVLFVALPFGSAYLDARLAPYLFILVLLSFSAAELTPRARRGLALLGLLFFLIRTGGTTVGLLIESEDWSRRLVALEHVPRGARVAALVTNRCPSPWHRNALNHLPSLAIVRRGAFTNDQFELGSTALLKVVAPGLGRFATDPSQIVTARPCPQARELGTMAAALHDLPRNAFDLVWLIDPPADLRPVLTRGFVPVWTDGRDLLLRIERRRLSEGVAPH